MATQFQINIVACFWGMKKSLWHTIWILQRMQDEPCEPGRLVKLNPKIIFQ